MGTPVKRARCAVNELESRAGAISRFAGFEARANDVLILRMGGHVSKVRQNRTFVAGFLAVTSNAGHADHDLVGPPGTTSGVACSVLADCLFERMPTSWCGQSAVVGRRCGIVG